MAKAGISMREAAQVTTLSLSTCRRWVDNYIAVQAGELPKGTQGQLKGWRTATARGGGLERRADPTAAEAIGRRQRGET